ncbi:hypothetical protein KIN20_014571 [Parelaphostrongylus tenuis]|uniref:Uncharacterized protein n=1 Tax=Parelaphostrongylus tenuis TaxID=148309 RepID=A0AAD5MF42_PARTN|nr:hypothetical protein KIN20_014571 [Parelaphostrongylus tenuis]
MRTSTPLLVKNQGITYTIRIKKDHQHKAGPDLRSPCTVQDQCLRSKQEAKIRLPNRLVENVVEEGEKSLSCGAAVFDGIFIGFFRYRAFLR